LTHVRAEAISRCVQRVFFGAVFGVVVSLHACGDASHIYEGRLYREDRQCLATKSSVDVVEGEAPGDCGARCLVQRTTDGSRAIYVSTMCAPFPFNFDATGSDPACADALAALTRNDTCLTDGGSTAPLPPPPVDAGSD
jgi:hypothetical protein